MIMIPDLIKNIFGTRNGRILKEYQILVKKINSLESKYQKYDEADFINETELLKGKYKKSNDLLTILPEAFAITREASVRTLGLRHFDEQLLGGIALHYGKIAEMKTGEGKTLVSTLPAYLNSLTGESVYIVTVNDYLAQRDAEWMGQIFKFLGLSVGVNLSRMDPKDNKSAYEADITYGTNYEFGFDYLRDNMVYTKEERVQRPLSYAVVDEVDSILITSIVITVY